MRRLHKTTILGLGILLLASQSAMADVVLRGDVGPAKVRVRLQTPDHIQVHAYRNPINARHACTTPLHYGPRVSRYDKRVAYRLSVMTGISKRYLVKQRARGATWKRIARINQIPLRKLRIAKNPQRFQKWMKKQHRRNGGGWGNHDGWGNDDDWGPDGDDHRRKNKKGKGRGGR